MLPISVLAVLILTSCLATPIVILAVLVGVYGVYIALERRRFADLPGPKFSNFFLGNVEQMLQYPMNRHLLWVTWGREYGPLFKVCFFHKVLVVATSPEMVQEFCQNRRYLKARQEYHQLGFLCGVRYMGQGLLTETNHDIWRAKRLAANQAFHKTYLQKMIKVFNEAGDRVVDKLATVAKENGPTKSIRLLDYIGRATLDVICEVAFSLHINSLDDDTSPFPAAVNTSLKMMTECFRDPFLTLKPWRRSEVKEGATAAHFLRETGRRLIRERIEKHIRGEETPTDILDLMVRNSRETYTEDQLVDEFITLFIAGQETTANSLAFLFSLLGQNPDALDRVQQEVDSQLADKTSIHIRDLDKLTLVESAWREALRLFPPAYGTIREMPQEGGYVDGKWIPGGASIMVNFLAVHYLHTEKGEQFRVDRYLNRHEPANTFVAFSSGQRSCIGRHFATFEAKIFISKLIQNFVFKLDSEQSFDVDESLTLRLKDGAKFFLTKREEIKDY